MYKRQVITIGAVTTAYPLTDCNCAQATAESIHTRTRYATRVATSATGTGTFKYLCLLYTSQTFIQAAQSGDWKTVGTTIAAGIWGAMGDEQRKRAKSVASDLLGRLSKELKSQASSLLNTAATIGKNLVNSLTQNFGKVSSETQTMLSGITQAFGNVKSPLATAAKAISAALSGGLLSSFPTIFAGFAGLVSTCLLYTSRCV